MRISLISKLTIAISAILLFFVILFAYLNIRTFKSLLLEAAISDADKLSETIIKTTHYEMLVDNRKRVYEMMREVGTLQGIVHIRMINKSGYLTFSTDREEIGRYLDKNEAGCNMCHRGSETMLQASTMSRSRLFIDKGGKQVVGMAKAIYNEASCSNASCHFHPAKQRILGVLDIIVSLDSTRTLTAHYRNVIVMLTIILLLSISLAITFFTHHLVNRPVTNLLAQTRKIAAGDLDARVQCETRDEMGDLSNAFNTMTESLRNARKELEDWGKNLEAKVEERTREITQIQNRLLHSEKMVSLGKLVAGIGHEINNPLTGILMFATLIEKHPSLDETLRKDMHTILTEAQRCAKIVRNLLDFSRESIPQKKPASLEKIMEASLALIGRQSSFHNVEIVRDYEPGVPLISVDENQMKQVFINMLLNASQAMPTGGRITVTIRQTADEAVITIADTGEGIAAENLGRIFDPFFTTKSDKGTGLGLSVSYGIIERHGGRIDVASTPTEGTRFTITLPLHPPDMESLAARSPGKPA